MSRPVLHHTYIETWGIRAPAHPAVSSAPYSPFEFELLPVLIISSCGTFIIRPDHCVENCVIQPFIYQATDGVELGTRHVHSLSLRTRGRGNPPTTNYLDDFFTLLQTSPSAVAVTITNNLYHMWRFIVSGWNGYVMPYFPALTLLSKNSISQWQGTFSFKPNTYIGLL